MSLNSEGTEKGVRVSSYSMSELSRGKFLVKSENITLQNCIGEGLYASKKVSTFK